MAQLRAGAVADGGSGGLIRRWAPLVVVLTGIAVGAGVLFYTQARSRELAIAGATAAARPWALAGPPCPVGFSGAWADPQYAPKKALIFNGVRFTRRAGHVDCSAISTGKGKTDFVPLCQFTGPILLEVETPGGVTRFQPDVGRPASVWVEDGQTRCVLAANPDL